jgi:hypothetical protein
MKKCAYLERQTVLANTPPGLPIKVQGEAQIGGPSDP